MIPDFDQTYWGLRDRAAKLVVKYAMNYIGDGRVASNPIFINRSNKLYVIKKLHSDHATAVRCYTHKSWYSGTGHFESNETVTLEYKAMDLGELNAVLDQFPLCMERWNFTRFSFLEEKYRSD